MVLVSVLRLSNIMAAVEKVEKECEEETLQTAFKKLRVDAERFVVFSFVSATVYPISEMDAQFFGREGFFYCVDNCMHFFPVPRPQSVSLSLWLPDWLFEAVRMEPNPR